MRKILFLALIFNMVAPKTSAEPVFRFDSTKQPVNANKKEETTPERPAYYDAYKKKKMEAPKIEASKVNEASQSSTAPAPANSEVPAPTVPPEVRQAIQDQLKNINPAVLEKVRPQPQIDIYSTHNP